MEDVREVVVRWKKNKLCMREACLPRKRRERERVIYSLRARLENVYPRGCRGVNAITFREMDLIALIIFNGRWEWKEKVHVENVERSTGIIEKGGGGGFRKNRDKLHSFGIDCLSNRYRTVAQSFGNPRSFAAYVLYYVSKGKECPYQISPGVRWMHGRVDNEYIYIYMYPRDRVSSVLWRNPLLICHRFGSELGGIGSRLILSIRFRTTLRSFRVTCIYNPIFLNRIFKKSNE